MLSEKCVHMCTEKRKKPRQLLKGALEVPRIGLICALNVPGMRVRGALEVPQRCLVGASNLLDRCLRIAINVPWGWLEGASEVPSTCLEGAFETLDTQEQSIVDLYLNGLWKACWQDALEVLQRCFEGASKVP